MCHLVQFKVIAILITITCLISAPKAISNNGQTIASIDVSVDPDTVVRTNIRHLLGVNTHMPELLMGTHLDRLTPNAGFEESFWALLKEAAPGMLRYPGGNWVYGHHFNLHIDGINHLVNGSTTASAFKPQHFLNMINQLLAEGVETTPMIHTSPVFASPEESAAFVAFMIGETTDNRAIGNDSFGRDINLPGFSSTSWGTVAYWANKRPVGVSRYVGTLYFQLGNEEWIDGCKSCICSAMTDYYDRTRRRHAMLIENYNPCNKTDTYYPAFEETFEKIRSLWPSSKDVQIGALALAGPTSFGSADAVRKTGDPWNLRLFENLEIDSIVPDFLTIHTYMYGKSGWENHSATSKQHNLLASHDALLARLKAIQNQVPASASQALREVPIYITEWNTHKKMVCTDQDNCTVDTIHPSSLIDALHVINWISAGMYMDELGGLVRWGLVNKNYKNETVGGSITLFSTHDTNSNSSIWKSSSFFAYKLLAQMHNKVVARTEPASPTFTPEFAGDAPHSDYWTPSAVPFITSAATISDDGQELAVLLLNKNTVDSFDVNLGLGTFIPEAAYTGHVINTVSPDQGHYDIFDCNKYEQGSNIASNEVDLTASSYESGASQTMWVSLPAHAAMLLKFTRQQGMGGVLNGDRSSPPLVDFRAGENAMRIIYGNPSGMPVKAVVEYLDGRWKWSTVIDETRGDTTPGASSGWVDPVNHIFHYAGKHNNGRWAVSSEGKTRFRIRLKVKSGNRWKYVGNWQQFEIQR